MFGFDTNCALNILFDYLEIQRTGNVVSGDDNTFVVNTDEISHSIRFDVFENSVNVNNMST